MPTSPTQIRIDKTIKEEATLLFSNLGMDMSSAVNIFLRQCVLRGGLPFSIEMPRYNQETIDAMIEAKRITYDNSVPSYSNMEDLMKAPDED